MPEPNLTTELLVGLWHLIEWLTWVSLSGSALFVVYVLTGAAATWIREQAWRWPQRSVVVRVDFSSPRARLNAVLCRERRS